MKQTQNTRVVSGGRRSGGILAGERKGSDSHSGQWRGSGVLWREREKATAVTCTIDIVPGTISMLALGPLRDKDQRKHRNPC